LLEKHYESSDKKFREYLLVCERLGKDPDPNKVPMDMGSFPYEVQLAFLIHDLLPDRWEGMSGSYLGKDWGAIGAILDSYNIDIDRQIILFFVKAMDNINSSIINKNMQKEQKRKEKSSKGKMNFPKGK
jgi:hypothetical protein